MELFTELGVETIGSCNRTCTTCLRQSYPTGSHDLPLRRTVETSVGRGDKMPTALFHRLMDETRDLGFSGKLVLQFFNEPLLDDRFPELCRYARSRLPENFIVFCTNADLMTPELAREFDGVVSQLNVALYMPPARQVDRRRELEAMFSETHLNFRLEGHVVSHFSPSENVAEMVSACVDQTCNTYNHMLLVNYTGAVSHCCEDVAADFGLGNVHDKTLSEVWFGARNRELIRTLSQPGGRRKLAYCRSCPRPDKGYGTPRLRLPVVPA